MVRFIDLGNQIYPLDKERDSFTFTWYDTIVDKFMEFCEVNYWHTWEEFEHDFRDAEMNYPVIDEEYLERFKSLFPKDWPEGVEEEKNV